MNWLKDIAQIEYLYIEAFLLFYLAYAVRMYFISKKLKVSIMRLFLKFILRSVYFALFIVALLGPSFGDIKKEIKAIGKDIYFAIDLSASMDATDINPSRLEKVKFEFVSILKNFNSDRVGLIVFSEEAFLQCPLTYDQNAVKLFMETLSTSSIAMGGTNLNAPLALAYSKLVVNNGTVEPIGKAKILVLITDGEHLNEQHSDEWLLKIKKAGIKLFILGVGTAKGSKIPTADGFKRDYSGQFVVSSVNETRMKEMCALSGGKYFELSAETNEIKNLVNKIAKEEGTFNGSRKIESAANKYFYFLFIALIFLVFDILISVKTIKI